jgi:hypothetical protein
MGGAASRARERIEEAVGALEGPFDLALAAHSLYNVTPIDAVIRGLIALSPHVVVLMDAGDTPEEAGMAWRQALYRRFRGRERAASPQFPHFYAVLLEMGIGADVEIVWTSANYVYESEAAMTAWWMEKLRLDEDRRAELRTALSEIAEQRDDWVGIYSRRRTALVWIDRARHGDAAQ